MSDDIPIDHPPHSHDSSMRFALLSPMTTTIEIRIEICPIISHWIPNRDHKITMASGERIALQAGLGGPSGASGSRLGEAESIRPVVVGRKGTG